MNQIMGAREGGQDLQQTKKPSKKLPPLPNAVKKTKNTAAEALAKKRLENKLKQTERKVEIEKQLKNPLQKEVRELIGLRPDQLSSDYINFEDGSLKKKHLNLKPGISEQRPLIKHEI
jgi:hypothetical protein